VTQNTGHGRQSERPATFGERLLFAIWLGGKVLGTDNTKEFAEAIGKNGSQVSKWIAEDPRPGWDSIKAVATAVGIDPAWLDDPQAQRAEVPADFPQWIAARRERERQSRRKA
jgi:transcriptional regulator with XRE-family HTH domain